MSKMSQTIIDIQEFVSSNAGRIPDERIIDKVIAKHGMMFEDIAREYLATFDDSTYDEENDVVDFENMLNDVEAAGWK